MIPLRIEELTKAVNSSDDFETWRPEFSPVSLSSLDDWLATQVQTRHRAQEELQKITSGSRHPIPIELEVDGSNNFAGDGHRHVPKPGALDESFVSEMGPAVWRQEFYRLRAAGSRVSLRTDPSIPFG
jgi:hypothetical protein